MVQLGHIRWYVKGMAVLHVYTFLTLIPSPRRTLLRGIIRLGRGKENKRMGQDNPKHGDLRLLVLRHGPRVSFTGKDGLGPQPTVRQESGSQSHRQVASKDPGADGSGRRRKEGLLLLPF